MAIQNKIEFSAMVDELVLRLGKVTHQFGNNPKIHKARRHLQQIQSELGEEGPSKERQFQRLSEIAAVCRVEAQADPKMEDDFYDLLDYLEYNA